MEKYADRINIIPLAQATCANMMKVDARNLLSTLENLETPGREVTVAEEWKAPARESLVRMLNVCQ
jgi:quinolinate synthase